ncbi:SH3 domain-containing protein [bacterium]|nr:SH3 domain-containing protein [bacterium]
MTADSAPVSSTLSQIQRSSAHSDLQPIAADYYNLTSATGQPVAGLLVLLDRRQRPVRAELHLPDSIDNQHEELAQRQAQLLITDRYSGDGNLTLNILYAQIGFDRVSIPLPAPPPPSSTPSWLRPVGLGLLAVIVFVAAGWFLNDLFTGEQAATVAPAIIDAPATAGETTNTVDSAAASPAETPFTLMSQTNGLPESRNALPLAIGQRVQIRSGYQVALRTQPGASAGEVVGAMVGGDQATIVNGPVWMPGTSDTIVWWRILLDDGTEAWVSANTSDLTLLEPAP